MKKIDHSKGVKTCIARDRAIFVGLQDHHCLCCSKSMPTKPQYFGENIKAAKESMLRCH